MNERIKNDLVNAMKTQDKETLSVIRMLKGAIQLEEINKRTTLSDDDIIGVISKQIKMRKESIAEFEKGNRTDLIEKTSKEIEILNKYMPEQISDDELERIIDEVIRKVDAHLVSDTGKVMKELVPLIKGKADMGKVSQLLKNKLSN